MRKEKFIMNNFRNRITRLANSEHLGTESDLLQEMAIYRETRDFVSLIQSLLALRFQHSQKIANEEKSKITSVCQISSLSPKINFSQT